MVCSVFLSSNDFLMRISPLAIFGSSSFASLHFLQPARLLGDSSMLERDGGGGWSIGLCALIGLCASARRSYLT